ncbi:prolipoprotein diacylglyceryl transferase [Enemella sp. A6]|uniref:prolipoprotein diacylglyceryl transferase n=1 Tax=Enemella sp. A6 TaxID=3440152 RepID=UPI003EBA9D86
MDLLLSIPSPSINGFQLGPVKIHFYALCIMAGIVIAYWLTSRRWQARGGRPQTVETIVMWAVPLGIIGSRIYHVLTHWGDYFGEGARGNPWAIWEGGLAIFGAIMFGALGAAIGARMTGARLAAFADALAPGMLIAQATGRLGNWFNQELFGGPDNGPLGLEIDRQHRPAGMKDVETFQPTFLYELSWNLTGAVILLLLDRKFALGKGKLFTLYLLIYGTGRFLIEGIRTDPSYMVGPLRTNQVTALVLALLGLVLFALFLKFRPGREDAVEVPRATDGNVPAADVEKREQVEKTEDAGTTEQDGTAEETPSDRGAKPAED